MTIDEQLTVDLWLLDALLTEHDSRSGRRDPDKLVTMERFQAGEQFYLSDGGYSRVFCNYTGVVHLTDKSRTEVKARWHRDAAQRVILRIEQRVEKWQTEHNCKI
jgi:hypothetical protein